MNKNAKKWLKALRSGEYKRTESQLRDADKFCCLGVACDLYAKEKKLKWEDATFLGHNKDLPTKVRIWLGLNESNGMYYTRTSTQTLTEKNDSGYSFKKIANIIEKGPEGLFVK